MNKLHYNRLFRFLVCLVLVLSFLVNLSPLKADATAVVGGVLTFEGLMAALYSMGIGIVATELTVEAWNNIGNSLTKAITDTGDSTITEAWIDLEAMYDSYIPGGGQDPDDELKWAEKLKHALSRGLLGAIAGWLCTLVNMGGFEVESDVASGFAFYNGYLLPDIATIPDISNNPVVLILYADTNPQAYCFPSSVKFQAYQYSGKPMYVYGFHNATCVRYTVSNGQWKYLTSSNYNSSAFCEPSAISWSNVDIRYNDPDTGDVIYSATDPVYVDTSIVEPTIYVGDIPQQIKDGEKDKDTLILPPIDPFRVIQFPDTALNDVNQLQQQLADGTITLDQYLDNVQLQDPTVTPSDPSDPSDPSISDGSIPDIVPYGFDLKDYFPFCIPFDIYEFFSVLIAEPQAPQFHWELHDLSGNTYSIDVDLSPWDSFAAVFRRMQLLLFIVGLAAGSRKFIKW